VIQRVYITFELCHVILIEGLKHHFLLDSINEGKNKLGLIWLKLKELIKLKDLIKILLSLIDLIKDFIGIKIKF